MGKELKNNIVIYNEGEIELNISIHEDTIWLTQKQLCDIFEKDQSVISRHITNIFKDNEVNKKSNMQKMHIANSDKPVSFYSLDIVLAVGYRTNSSKAIKFRQWATSILKNYIQNGYAINSEKITNDRFVSLEQEVTILKEKVTNIEDKHLTPTQGIFYNGQIFDAHSFVSDLIRSAKKNIKLIDNYVDDTTLSLFSKNQNINVTIYTHTLSKALKIDLEKYNKQYQTIEIKTNKNFHDRFLIIDDKEVYHLGASLKDLGKKVFAFSKMDREFLNVLEKLE